MIKSTIRLFRKEGRLYASENGLNERSVSIVWARPMTGVGMEIALLTDDTEYAFLDGLSSLDSESEVIANEELQKRYIIPVILKIIKTNLHLGNRYYEVLTDRGYTKFIVKNPIISIRETINNGKLIRDVVGNVFRIRSLVELDQWSRREYEKMC